MKQVLLFDGCTVHNLKPCQLSYQFRKVLGKLGPGRLGPERFFAANWAPADWAPANWAPADWAPANWALADWAPENLAVLYYTSCWDFVGIKIEIVGMDPNCCHPKPRPTTPRYLFDSLLFLYQKQMYIHFKNYVLGFRWDDPSNHDQPLEK